MDLVTLGLGLSCVSLGLSCFHIGMRIGRWSTLREIEVDDREDKELDQFGKMPETERDGEPVSPDELAQAVRKTLEGCRLVVRWPLGCPGVGLTQPFQDSGACTERNTETTET